MKCQSCGSDIPEGHSFCASCFEKNKKQLLARANAIMGKSPVRTHPPGVVSGILFINTAVQMISRHAALRVETGAILFVATNILICMNWRLRLDETELLAPGIYPGKNGDRMILGGSVKWSVRLRGWPMTFFECGSEEPTYHKRWIVWGLVVDVICFVSVLGAIAYIVEKF